MTQTFIDYKKNKLKKSISAINGMVWGGPNAVIELAEKLIYDTNYQTPFFNDYDW